MVYEQSCCFPNINLLLFCHSRRYLSSLLYSSQLIEWNGYETHQTLLLYVFVDLTMHYVK